MLKKGMNYKSLNNSYVIFITEDDYYKQGLPKYTITRQIGELGKPFNDGSNIIYVNGRYVGEEAQEEYVD